MIRLLELLTNVLLGKGETAPREANPLQTNGTTSSRWNEALIACQYDDTARKYLDYLGLRR